MGSTGEPDRKRRHFSSISPTAATAKKQPFLPSSEDKKLDSAVLQYQNQKLVQKLEAQKAEYISLENKFSQLKGRQKTYDNTLSVVNKSWEELVDDLESCSMHTRDSASSREDFKHLLITEDEASSPQEDAFLSRLIETGATESSSMSCPNQMEEDGQTACEKTKNILGNIVSAIDDLWYFKDGLYAAILKALPEEGLYRQKVSRDLEKEVKNLRSSLEDLHLKHRSLAREMQSHQDNDAKNKAELKRLRGELESTVAELEEINGKLGES
ncbi:hypothetical protein L1049_017830 [Liquidambar formosana]|uniref:E3 ubiquitin protein ligase n=1 Tax=Liquidambar formosana TaxID=63359 RepID=A0AAP0NHX5_LIQFO